MNNKLFKINFLCMIFCLLFGFSVFAVEKKDFYLGVDAEKRDTRFVKNQGKGLFYHRTDQITLLGGYYFHPGFAVEMGYSTNFRLVHTYIASENGSVLGVPERNRDVSKNSFKIKGPQIHLIFKYPVGDSFALFSKFGFTYSRILAKHAKMTSDVGIPKDDEKIYQFIQKKLLFRAGFGLLYALNDNFDIKANVVFENTDRIKNLSSNQNKGQLLSLKNTYILGLGLVLKL